VISPDGALDDELPDEEWLSEEDDEEFSDELLLCDDDEELSDEERDDEEDELDAGRTRVRRFQASHVSSSPTLQSWVLGITVMLPAGS
jgi:hypothetical protein